ncbi:MAG: NitT/TauT family transport system ATP-binding [Geobacteraceae bacterium]|nr:MAG: NitT/TauT family transport system ATP-binding [Geobacteraceae bacterium]
MANVELKNVSKVFLGQSGVVHGLTGVNLAIPAGEFLCVVGPSGCGKTTLLNVIAGFELPDQGDVLVDGARIGGPSSDRFVIFQEPALFPWLNVRQNIVFGLRMAGVDQRIQDEKAEALLKMVHLTRFASSFINELSGGMKQRVALARALAMDPAVLLMDEPFAALDAQTRDMLHEELEAVWQQTNKTIIFVTHNVREAVRLGSRVILMSGRGGSILKEYPIDLPRNRYLEDVQVVTIASKIRDELRQEAVRANEAGGTDAH